MEWLCWIPLGFLSDSFMQSLEFWMGGEGASHLLVHSPNPFLTSGGRRGLKNIRRMEELLCRAQGATAFSNPTNGFMAQSLQATDKEKKAGEGDTRPPWQPLISPAFTQTHSSIPGLKVGLPSTNPATSPGREQNRCFVESFL